MYEATVEIYADTPNAAILRHPGRRFPGLLLQGDTLNALCQDAQRLHALLPPGSEVAEELAELRDQLTTLRDHYTATLKAHDLPLPYPD
ncbi:DUF6959 family protein [Aliiroseovarius sp.]|uniref:DUF6959 family protein n=1 Tax=Aliiroseovarius sp. TaxID=1872442 RepID=UPI003BAB0DD8